MSDCCGAIDAAKLEQRQRRVLLQVLAINLIAFLMMVTGAWLSGSSSLLSGTLDNLGDAATYAMSLAVVGAGVVAKARVAFFKGLLIASAALFVAVQIVLHLADPVAPIAGTMSTAAALNLGANACCLWLLRPLRNQDVNMASVYECSRNDIFDGLAVLLAAGLVAVFDSAWPDILAAVALLVLFSRSAFRVLRDAWRDLSPASA